MKREQRALCHLLQLFHWALQRGADEFTFADVKDQFPKAYRGSAQAEKKWTRDKTQLRRLGLRLRLVGRCDYVVDSSASRARDLRLTPAEVAVLNDVIAFLPSVHSSYASHYVERALRKLALSGLTLNFGLGGPAATTRAAWEAANVNLPALPTRPSVLEAGPLVDILYADPETGQEQKHRVQVERVHLGNKVIYAWDERADEPRVFLGAFVRSLRMVADQEWGRWSSSGLRMSGYGSIVDDLGDELARDANPSPGLAPRHNITSMQRALGIGYLLLNAMVEAYPVKLTWDDAMRLSGAADRKELERIIVVLKETTLPGLGGEMGDLAVEQTSDGVGLYMHQAGTLKLALRPVEAGMLASAARTASSDAESVKSLSRKLRALLDEKEQKYAIQTEDTFDFGAAP